MKTGSGSCTHSASNSCELVIAEDEVGIFAEKRERNDDPSPVTAELIMGAAV